MTADVIKGNKVIRVGDTRPEFQARVLRDFDIFFNAVVPKKEGGYLVVDISKPAMQTYRQCGQEFLVSSLPEEEEVLDSYLAHATKRNLVFDVGAYCGLSTYKLSHEFRNVVAFEPDVINRSCLTINVHNHWLTNVLIVGDAMSSETGRNRFWVDASMGSKIALPEFKRGRFEIVNTVSLYDACARYGVPDLICMDVEGAEVAILEKAEFMTLKNTAFAIDTNHDEKNGWTFTRVESLLRDYGYNVETKRPGGFYTTWGWK